jgi:cardiolipin synthase
MRRHRHRHRLFRPILRPFVGRKLPPELWVRNVGRLAEALPLGVEDLGFEVLLRRIDGAPLFGGNTVEVYFRGLDAFRAMEQAAAQAQREILIESYILKDDRTGQRLLQSLKSAAARGIEVRVVADALGSSTTKAQYWKELEAAGVGVRLYHPLFTHLWYQPFRDHRKLFVVDREIAFTGGMNIGEEYGSTFNKPGETWRDTHARVVGPASWEMSVVFSEGWTHAGGDSFEMDPLPADRIDAPGARILVLDSRPNRGQAESASALAAITGAARRYLWITNAYFAPGRRAVGLLRDAVKRGVDVRLLVPGKTDVPIVRRAGHGYYKSLLRRGIRIFEYQPAILHAKTLVADDYVSVVGSTNLDYRSFIFNAECDLVILDHATAGKMAAAFRKDMESSVEITAADWKKRSVGKRIGDRLARWLSPVL